MAGRMATELRDKLSMRMSIGKLAPYFFVIPESSSFKVDVSNCFFCEAVAKAEG